MELFFLKRIVERILRLLGEDLVQNLLMRLIKIIIGLILLIILVPASYILWGYYQIDCGFRAKEKIIVQPQVEAGSLSEVAYVAESRIVTCIKNRTKKVYFWVRVPSTHTQYLCEWQGGFAGFKKDDAVTLIHQIEGTDISMDRSGYLIGLQGKVKDKTASIWSHGVEEIKD